eukprot:tig00000870_g5125.t1
MDGPGDVAAGARRSGGGAAATSSRGSVRGPGRLAYGDRDRDREAAAGASGSGPRVSGIVLPGSKSLRAVRGAQLLLGLYYALAIPYRIAFAPPPASLVSNVLSDWLCDALFLALAASNLTTAYETRRGAVELRLEKIFKHYLKTNLVLDLLAVVPFDLMAYAAGLSSTTVVWLRVNRYLATRPVLSYLRQRNANATGSSGNSLAGVLKLLLLTVFIGHYGACCFFYVGALVSPERSWFARLREDPRGAGLAGGLHAEESGGGFEALRYFVSLFWSFAMMTSMGPGSIAASNSAEIFAFLAGNIVSLCWYSLLTMYLSDFLQGKDSEMVKLRDEFLAIGRFIKERGIGGAIASDMKTFFDFRAANRTTGDNVFKELPRSLQVQVARQVCRPLIAANRVFADCEEGFVDALAVLLQESTLMPHSWIFRRNDLSQNLYFIASGVVDVVAVDAVTRAEARRELSAGACLGDLAFFFGLRQTSSARVSATGHCTLYVLSRRDFQSLISHYQDEEERIFKRVLANVADDDKLSMSAVSLGTESIVSSAMGESNTVKNLRDVVRVAKEKREQDKTVRMLTEAHRGNLEGVKRFLEMDVDVDSADYDGRTALHIAACDGHTDIIHLLIDRGANLNAKDRYGGTPIIDAIRHQQDEAAGLLIRLGAVPQFDDPAMMLCTAAAAGDLGGLKRLVECGVSPSLQDYDGRSALHLAASNGNRAVAEYLVGCGVDLDCVDRKRGTPLQDAVRGGHFHVAGLLADAGARMLLPNEAGIMCNGALDGDVESLRLLIRYSVPVNSADYDGRTALHLAAAEGQLQAVELLLHSGADANAEDERGFRPLDEAARHGQKLVALLLLEHGAELSGAPGSAQRRAAEARLARLLSADTARSCQKCASTSTSMKSTARARAARDGPELESDAEAHACKKEEGPGSPAEGGAPATARQAPSRSVRSMKGLSRSGSFAIGLRASIAGHAASMAYGGPASSVEEKDGRTSTQEPAATPTAAATARSARSTSFRSTSFRSKSFREKIGAEDPEPAPARVAGARSTADLNSEASKVNIKRNIAQAVLRATSVGDREAGNTAEGEDYDPAIVRAQEEFDRAVAELTAELEKESDRLRVLGRRAALAALREQRSFRRAASTSTFLHEREGANADAGVASRAPSSTSRSRSRRNSADVPGPEGPLAGSARAGRSRARGRSRPDVEGVSGGGGSWADVDADGASEGRDADDVDSLSEFEEGAGPAAGDAGELEGGFKARPQSPPAPNRYALRLEESLRAAGASAGAPQPPSSSGWSGSGSGGGGASDLEGAPVGVGDEVVEIRINASSRSRYGNSRPDAAAEEVHGRWGSLLPPRPPAPRPQPSAAVGMGFLHLQLGAGRDPERPPSRALSDDSDERRASQRVGSLRKYTPDPGP